MRRSSHLDAEIIIIGGGLGGLTLAASLGASGISVICLEREEPKQQRGATFDGRTTAIAGGPKKVLDACGVWEFLAPEACPILSIRVADQDSPPALDFDYKEVGTEPFGWIVENRKLREGLERRIAKLKDHVRIIAPARMQSIDCHDDRPASVTLTDGRILTCQLIIGADGRRSETREQAGIKAYGWNYGQTAIVCTVQHSQPHDNIAVENFLPNGPLATLPMTKQRCSVVWSEKAATADYLMQLDEKSFVQELESRIGPWLGKIKVEGKVFAYPLNLRHAQRYTATRLALISEAAHGIHPIAGQGLNIGMRDIAALNEELTKASRLGLDLGHPTILQSYEKARKFDTGTMVLGMDMLVRLFSNAIPPVQAARRFGLGVVGHMPPLKRFFMRTAVGQ